MQALVEASWAQAQAIGGDVWWIFVIPIATLILYAVTDALFGRGDS